MNEVVQTPAVKRFLLGITPEKVQAIFFGKGQKARKAFMDEIHAYCRTANPEAYRKLGPKVTLRTLWNNASEFK